MVHSKSLFFRPPQTLLKHLLGKEQKVIFCSLEIVGVKNWTKFQGFSLDYYGERRKEGKKERKKDLVDVFDN